MSKNQQQVMLQKLYLELQREHLAVTNGQQVDITSFVIKDALEVGGFIYQNRKWYKADGELADSPRSVHFSDLFDFVSSYVGSNEPRLYAPLEESEPASPQENVPFVVPDQWSGGALFPELSDQYSVSIPPPTIAELPLEEPLTEEGSPPLPEQPTTIEMRPAALSESASSAPSFQDIFATLLQPLEEERPFLSIPGKEDPFARKNHLDDFVEGPVALRGKEILEHYVATLRDLAVQAGDEYATAFAGVAVGVYTRLSISGVNMFISAGLSQVAIHRSAAQSEREQQQRDDEQQRIKNYFGLDHEESRQYLSALVDQEHVELLQEYACLRQEQDDLLTAVRKGQEEEDARYKATVRELEGKMTAYAHISIKVEGDRWKAAAQLEELQGNYTDLTAQLEAKTEMIGVQQNSLANLEENYSNLNTKYCRMKWMAVGAIVLTVASIVGSYIIHNSRSAEHSFRPVDAEKQTER